MAAQADQVTRVAARGTAVTGVERPSEWRLRSMAEWPLMAESGHTFSTVRPQDAG